VPEALSETSGTMRLSVDWMACLAALSTSRTSTGVVAVLLIPTVLPFASPTVGVPVMPTFQVPVWDTGTAWAGVFVTITGALPAA